MRRFLIAVLVVLMAVSGAVAASKVYSNGTVAVSLSGVAATGAGDEFVFVDGYLQKRSTEEYTWQVVFTGTPTAITTNLEGSVDGTNWFTLDTSTSTSNEMRHVVNKPVSYLRCNIASYTVNGSTATCSIWSHK